MVAIARGSALFANQNPPHYITNKYYLPPGYTDIGNATDGNASTTTATRVIYSVLAIWEAHTFQSITLYNTGTADNGKRIRVMVFNDNGVNGGPGTLAKDFGQITLTGVAAARTLSSSWAATPGIYWLATWTESSCKLTGMAPWRIDTAVGYAVGALVDHYTGTYTPPNVGLPWMTYDYVDTAYGAAPATAVTPTATAGATGVGNSAALRDVPTACWLRG